MNSGDKGKRFERKVAEILTSWSGVDLMRTPMSGGWAGETADLVPKFGQFFPFVVECKHEEGWELDNIIQNNGPFPGWLAQAIEQADYKTTATGILMWPALVFTRNYRPTYILLPQLVWVYGLIGHRPNTIYIRPEGQQPFIVGEITQILFVMSYQKVMENYERRFREQSQSRSVAA